MDDPNDPVELHRARRADEAHALRAHLEAAGIPARVDGELLGGIVGEVPFGWVTAPRLMVPRGRMEVAEAVLADFLAGSPASARSQADETYRTDQSRTRSGGTWTTAASWGPDFVTAATELYESFQRATGSRLSQQAFGGPLKVMSSPTSGSRPVRGADEGERPSSRRRRSG